MKQLQLRLKHSKYISLLLAFTLVMMTAMPAIPAMAAAKSGAAFTIGDVSGKLVIIHTNDTHGRDMADDGVLGTAAIAQLKKDYEAAGADTLLLSAGDACQGTALVNQSQGADAIAFMNLAGYDAMCPGNHEFDWGVDNLKALIKDAKFPVLAANIVYKNNKSVVFDSKRIFTTKSGLKVGVFGLDTPETATKASPDKMKGLEFLQGKELYACAQNQVDQLKASGCDLIVALGHLGIDEESAASGSRSVDVVNHVTGIDLFIDGHSHTVMENGAPVDKASYPSFRNNSDTLIVSTGSNLANAGGVLYDTDTKELSSQLVSADAYTGKDKTVEAAVKAKNDEINKELGKVFAKTEVMLNGEREPGNRTQETNLGDFAADAIRWSANKSIGGTVDAAITNGGGIRESIPAGDISMLDMKTVFPFGNQVAVMELTGQELLEALEAATYAAPAALGAFPQVSGITFTLDTSKPYKNGEAYGTYYRCANPGTRVKNVMVGGVPLDLERTYTIATNDFTAAGGDTYYSFKDAYQENGYVTGVSLEDALIDYTTTALKGVITAEQYGQPAARIYVRGANQVTELPETGSPELQKAASIYRVIRGDTLWKISNKKLGDGGRWPEIYALNKSRIANPNIIYVDQLLELPAS